MPKQEKKEKATKFSKAQILKAEKYKGQHDIIDALLAADKKYSLEDIDKIIKNFLKGGVE